MCVSAGGGRLVAQSLRNSSLALHSTVATTIAVLGNEDPMAICLPNILLTGAPPYGIFFPLRNERSRSARVNCIVSPRVGVCTTLELGIAKNNQRSGKDQQ